MPFRTRTSSGERRLLSAKAKLAWHALSVPSYDVDGWQLESGVERHAEAPETFEIPNEAIRSRLVPGCDAKLLFTLRGPDGPRVERKWVRVTGYTEWGYLGVLNNQPRMNEAPVSLGERVEFGPDHVIDALPPENWNPETQQYE